MRITWDLLWIGTSIISFFINTYSGIIVTIATLVILLKEYNIQELSSTSPNIRKTKGSQNITKRKVRPVVYAQSIIIN